MGTQAMARQVNTKQPEIICYWQHFYIFLSHYLWPCFFYHITCDLGEREKLGAQKFQHCLTIRATLETKTF